MLSSHSTLTGCHCGSDIVPEDKIQESEGPILLAEEEVCWPDSNFLLMQYSVNLLLFFNKQIILHPRAENEMIRVFPRVNAVRNCCSAPLPSTSPIPPEFTQYLPQLQSTIQLIHDTLF